MWLSCESFPNPLGALGNNHWIMYEFDNLQGITSMDIWNANHPDYLTAGVKTLRVDYSPDGTTWTELGMAELQMADASPEYTGSNIELGGFDARYVLFTSIENHGGSCTGLSEVRFNLGETTATEDTYLSSLITIAPNPADQEINIAFGDIQSRDINYQLVDATGKILMRDQTEIVRVRDGLILPSSSLPDGHYTLQVQTDEGTAAKQIIILHAK